MQSYLLLVLSGVISGSTVLAQEVAGYAAPGCSGSTTFTYTPTTVLKCFNTTELDTKSVKVPEGAQCGLYLHENCVKNPLIVNPGCTEIDLESVKSYTCDKAVAA